MEDVTKLKGPGSNASIVLILQAIFELVQDGFPRTLAALFQQTASIKQMQSWLNNFWNLALVHKTGYSLKQIHKLVKHPLVTHVLDAAKEISGSEAHPAQFVDYCALMEISYADLRSLSPNAARMLLTLSLMRKNNIDIKVSSVSKLMRASTTHMYRAFKELNALRGITETPAVAPEQTSPPDDSTSLRPREQPKTGKQKPRRKKSELTAKDLLEAYEYLGVQPGDSWRKIQEAYRQRAKELHPDSTQAGARKNQRDFAKLSAGYRLIRKSFHRLTEMILTKQGWVDLLEMELEPQNGLTSYRPGSEEVAILIAPAALGQRIGLDPDLVPNLLKVLNKKRTSSGWNQFVFHEQPQSPSTPTPPVPAAAPPLTSGQYRAS